MMSIFISWIFAKSVTNAANLGASYGIVGGLAYASYWLSIPVGGGRRHLPALTKCSPLCCLSDPGCQRLQLSRQIPNL
jgi:hypothetical protein